MDVLYVILAVAAVAIAFIFWSRKSSKDRPQLEEPKASAESARPRSPSSSAAASNRRVSAEEKGATSVAPHVSEPVARSEAPANETADASVPIAEEPAVVVPIHKEASRPSIAHVSDVEGLRQGLAKSRGTEGIFGRLVALLTGKKELGAEIASDVEQVLLSSDVGVSTTETLLARVKENLSKGQLQDADAVWDGLRSEALRILSVDGTTGAFPLRDRPTVVLLVGVNGAGKTTTIGKLATRLKAEGRSVVLAAADTFRAAAVQQLVVWGNRVGVEVVRGKDGADPGSVVFDAVQHAKEIGADVVLADTAGRLHTKSNLMAELGKIVRTTGKAMPGAPHEVLLVVDATNGQNALAQAREFQEALPLSGIVLTKLDGTAKGGVVLGICDTLHLPIRFIGLGEKATDLYDFVPADFVEALLG